MTLKVWKQELRLPFLILPLIFVLIGVSMAWKDGFLNPVNAILTIVGVLMLHASVNVLNDYFDYKSGIDIATTPTPFSGGSRILPEKLLTPNSVLSAGLLFLIIGSMIGIYLLSLFSFPIILITILILSIFSVIAYSSILSRFGLGELFIGLNFGPLLMVGTYMIQSGSFVLTATLIEPFLVGLIVGILTAGIVYINEFPDTLADKSKGRMHLVARLGKATASKVFVYLIMSAYILVIIGVLVNILPIFTLISLLLIPKMRGVFKILKANYDKINELIPAMGNNILATMWTGITLLIAYLAWGIILIGF